MKKIRTIGCKEAIEHLLSYIDKDLGTTQNDEMEKHLDSCRTCFSRGEFEKHLKAQLRETGDEAARPELKSRIKNILGRF